MPTVKETGIIETDNQSVAACEFRGFLSQAVNRTRKPHMFPTSGAMDDAMEVAKGRLFDKAKTLKATHVVITYANNPTMAGHGTLAGNAYRCAPPTSK